MKIKPHKLHATITYSARTRVVSRKARRQVSPFFEDRDFSFTNNARNFPVEYQQFRLFKLSLSEHKNVDHLTNVAVDNTFACENHFHRWISTYESTLQRRTSHRSLRVVDKWPSNGCKQRGNEKYGNVRRESIPVDSRSSSNEDPFRCVRNQVDRIGCGPFWAF